jgi:long-chain-acyl-CoA dehydrogenase
MYRSTCRNFYETNCKPFHREWEDLGEVPRDLWKQAGNEGMLCVTTPEAYGGLGLDILYSSVHWQEQSYSFCTGPGFSLHSEIVAPYVLHYGTEEQKQEWLPKMISGEAIGSIAMTEPGAGSDLQGMRTTATKDGSDYIINGSKVFITNGWLSDVCIICAKTDPEAGAKGISLFLVDTTTPGFKKGKKLKKMGMKAQDTAELFFEDMRVPASALLGEEGRGFVYLMEELPQERLLIADMGIAASEGCYETTRSYVKDRKAFGKPLANLQTIKHTLAKMKTDIVVGRTFVDHCLSLHANKQLDTATASMAKAHGSDLQNKVAYDCVQLHGGWGYMWEYDVCRAFVDGRVQPIYGGTNEIMMEVVARTI